MERWTTCRCYSSPAGLAKPLAGTSLAFFLPHKRFLAVMDRTFINTPLTTKDARIHKELHRFMLPLLCFTLLESKTEKIINCICQERVLKCSLSDAAERCVAALHPA